MRIVITLLLWLYKLNLKYNFDSVVTTILFTLCGFSSGCVTVEKVPLQPFDSNQSKSSYDLPKRNEVIAQPVTPLLQRSGGLAFSEEGILFFANHGKSGTIGKYRLGQKSEPETFIDLSEWISSSDDQDLRVEGLRIDAEGRLLIRRGWNGQATEVFLGCQKIGNIG